MKLIVRLNWEKDEESLYQELATLARKFLHKNNVNLIIETGYFSDAELFFSGVVTALILEEDFELADDTEISFVRHINQKELLRLSQLKYKLVDLSAGKASVRKIFISKDIPRANPYNSIPPDLNQVANKKILVGIMFCIENEVDQCISAIQDQDYPNYEYFIIDNLPNKEAHSRLYRTFMDHSHEYDLFIKIDADMVLSRTTFFSEVVEYHLNHPNVDDLQVAVYDFFTDRLTYGLHIYSNRVKWQESSEKIFVDHLTSNQPYVGVNDSRILAPAAHHCPNPSRFQAFHFGLHKAIKVTQYGRDELHYASALSHWDNVITLMENLKEKQNPHLAFAVIGAYEGIFSSLTFKEVDFNNKRSKLIFSEWDALTDSEILLRATQLASLLLYCPVDLLLELIILRRNKSMGDRFADQTFVKNLQFSYFRKHQNQSM